MCDTQVMLDADGVWFAKNSDREPGEPQVVIRLPRAVGDPRPHLRATHLEIEQVPDRHAVLLSKPIWMWGAEMGANERGLVIGNQAIFSRLRTLEPGLLGMDLVRLGLERAATARQALDVITGLLERHGQGGPAGYRDQRFCYDNSFILADPEQAWVLETAGRHWAAKRVQRHWALSNCLTLGGDYDLCSADLQTAARRRGPRRRAGVVDFAAAFDTRLMPLLAGARRRRALSMRCLETERAPGLERLFAHLRSARRGREHAPLSGGNGDVCMHAAGPIRRSQTTGSMVSRLTAAASQHWFTGTSAPCLSLFRPAGFGDAPGPAVTPLTREPYAPLWRAHERVHRRALSDAGLRAAVRADAADTEAALIAAMANGRSEEIDALAADWDRRQAERIAGTPLQPPATPAGRFWRRQNRLDRID